METDAKEQFDICERTLAQLRIYSNVVAPENITALSDLTPSDAVEAGRKKRLSSGRMMTGKVNGWWLSSEEHVTSRDLRDHLDWLLEKAYAKKAALHKLQAEDDVRMWVACIWWASANGHAGPTLEPSHMAKLAELNLQCQFEFADYSES